MLLYYAVSNLWGELNVMYYYLLFIYYLFCLLEQRRRHDNKLEWHDPAVVDAHPFKYTESIVSAASALNCMETALC
jgi:hypothetical protein